GDLKTYAFNNDRAENGAVEFDVDTMRPTYRLHIGQFGMSNALRIARRLKLPKELLRRAHKYLKRRKGKTGELARLQQLREEAEQAKVEALAARHEADREKEEFERKKTALDREAAEKAALNELRANLKAGGDVREQHQLRERTPVLLTAEEQHDEVERDGGGRRPGAEHEPAGERREAEPAQDRVAPPRGECRDADDAGVQPERRQPAVREEQVLQQEADGDRERGAAAEHDADQSIQDQVHARRQHRELDVEARPDEERGGQDTDAGDFLLAHTPH